MAEEKIHVGKEVLEDFDDKLLTASNRLNALAELFRAAVGGTEIENDMTFNCGMSDMLRCIADDVSHVGGGIVDVIENQLGIGA